MKRLIIWLALLVPATYSLHADVAETLRSLIDSHDYAAAATAGREYLDANPDAKDAGAVNALLGEALMHSGDREGARERLGLAAARGVADAHRLLGRMAYEDYDFATASEQYRRYRTMKQKASKPVAPGAAVEESRITLAQAYMQRVERIEVIDSIAVGRDGFFTHYRLSASAGRILSPGQIPFAQGRSQSPAAYASERGGLMMWSQCDSLGTSRLVQSVRMNDGSWSEPEYTDSTLNIGNAAYPFMMPDGMTLYFAADGPQSLGGYDIFMATCDPADGSFRTPQNLGMPYNSPYDDLMLAIDEANGVGWWATDRNSPGGDLTIYVFIPSEIRDNYPEDTENLAALARLTDISLTQDENSDYSQILETIRSINPDDGTPQEQFRLMLPGGTVYTRFDDFASQEAAEAMQQLLDTQEQLRQTLDRLGQMREQYHSHPSSELTRQILALEKETEQLYRRVRTLRSQAIRAEHKAAC